MTSVIPSEGEEATGDFRPLQGADPECKRSMSQPSLVIEPRGVGIVEERLGLSAAAGLGAWQSVGQDKAEATSSKGNEKAGGDGIGPQNGSFEKFRKGIGS